ncbi:hypothetical protein [Myroides sp. N17-2]|uniref:hypothetical protein n=1 Tax=Myroides sp. N17-2 TaxID=2030799 RepID=UPI000EFB14AE|nr:hypothetical protein [Myroides sp. N17-2]
MKDRTTLGLVLLFSFFGLLGVYIFHYMGVVITEEKEKTDHLSQNVTKLFSNRDVPIPYSPSTIKWNGKYIILDTDRQLNKATYKLLWNEDFELSENYPGENLNGLVLVESTNEIVGEYVNDLFSNSTDNKPKKSFGNAYQCNYVIHYYDYNKQAIIARDTLIGEEPPQHKKRSESGYGRLPLTLDAHKSIRDRINK